MNKMLKVAAILGVLALIGLLGGVVAFAQSDAPGQAAPALAQVETAGQDSAPDLALPAANGYGQRRGASAGLITAEEAAWIQNRGGPANRGNQGSGPGMGPGPHLGAAPGLGLVDPAEMHAAIAGALGITVEELEAALAEGTPLVVLAGEQGVEIEVVRAAMATVREAAINQALADGTITAEQAEWLLSRPVFGARAGSGAGQGNSSNGVGIGRGNAGSRMGAGHGHGRGQWGNSNLP